MLLYADKRRFFPDPLKTLGDGLVAIGDGLDVELLLEAYSFGIFPWPQSDEMPMMWFSPAKRGVLDLAEFHVAKSLQKSARKSPWKIRWNSDFEQVIRLCAESPRPLQDGTWITPDMEQGYIDFHEAGYAHSIECWDGDRLIGGMYGVYVAGVFSGESMFYLKPNASKFCFWAAVQELKANGIAWMDVQMVTPNVEAFGGKYITKTDFFSRLEAEKGRVQELKLPSRDAAVNTLKVIN